jgi:hypothetical protein
MQGEMTNVSARFGRAHRSLGGLWPWAKWSARPGPRAGTIELASLSGEDPFGTLGRIGDHLGSWRPDRRADLPACAQGLADLDAVARRIYRDATRRYLAALQREPAETLSAWGQTVETCLMRLAHAHQSLLVPWSNPRKRAGLPRELAPAVLARALRAGAASIKWSYLRGAPQPAGVWGDMCRLYAMAESRACARTPVAPAPGLEPRSSIEREFLEACMLSAARPLELRPEQVDIAERATHFCGPGFALSGAEDLRFGHLIDVEGGDGPRLRDAEVVPTPAWRSFGIDGGDRLLAALLRLVQSDGIPPRAFGAEVGKEVVVATLRHLEACWLPRTPANPPDTGTDRLPELAA